MKYTQFTLLFAIAAAAAFGTEKVSDVPTIEFKAGDTDIVTLQCALVESVRLVGDRIEVRTGSRTYSFTPAADTALLYTIEGQYKNIVAYVQRRGPAIPPDETLLPHLRKVMENQSLPLVERQLAAVRFWATTPHIPVSSISISAN